MTAKSSSQTNEELKNQVTHLEQRIAALEALQEVALAFASELGLNRILALILSSAIDVIKASAGSLLLHNAATQELVFKVVQGGSGKALRNKRIKNDEGIAGWVFTRKRPVIVQDVRLDTRFLDRIDKNFKFHTTAMVAAPLIYKGTPIGVIEVINKKAGKFDEDDRELLKAFAAQSAVLIENARLFEQVVTERDRILAVEDEVRRELARELHDGPSQLLSATIMGLRFLRQVIEKQPERAQAEINELERLTTQSLYQVRNMLFNLRPVALETQGLSAALRLYVERQGAESRLRLNIDPKADGVRFSPKIEGAAFSIIQEAVGNSKKHAQANTIWISVRKNDEGLVLTVRDDGKGFDVATVESAYAQRGSLGLLNMKERAELCNGKLSIESKPGKGTIVALLLPIETPRESA